MTIANALRYLFPNANPLIDYRIEDSGNGSTITAWNLPDPQPSAAQLQAASDAYDAQQAQQASDAAALRTLVRNTAQSAVGVALTSLTAAQVRALLAVLLWKNGALDKSGTVRPLDEWAS